MRKCDKDRIKRIRHNELIVAAKKRVRAAYLANGYNPIGHNDTDLTAAIVKQLGNKYLHAIESDPDRFSNFPLHQDLVRLAKDELVDRALQISKQ